MTKLETERISVVETKIDSMHEDIVEIKRLVINNNHISRDEVRSSFAGKWVEKSLYPIFIVLITIVGWIVSKL
jgi:hypothetical protein